MRCTLFLLPLLVFAACHTTKTPLPPGPREDHAARIKAYEDKYMQFGSSREERPDFAEFKTSGVFLREQYLGNGLRLVLKLGELTEIKSGNERYYRTGSRYQLLQGKKVLCEAESTFSKDMNPSETWCRIMFHAGSSNVLIEEEHDWSTTREIVMVPKQNGDISAWEAKLVGVPKRDGGPGTTHGEGQLLGSSNRKIYIFVDGRYYAFPVERVGEVRFLGFLPG